MILPLVPQSEVAGTSYHKIPSVLDQMKVSRYYMALRSVSHDPISLLNSPSRSMALGVIWAGLLTALVAGPWLGVGYLFGTDWPGPRRFDFPANISSAAPLQALLAAVAIV